MKILVTGGAGYLGSHAAQKIIASGHSVVIYDNLSSGFREAIPSNAEFIFGDVRDRLMLTRVMKDKRIDAVVHCAAKLLIPESVRYPLDYYENNTLGTLSVAQACVENGINKLVFASTGSLYGNANPPDRLISEEGRTEPLNPYAHSKLMSEQILQDFDKAYGLRTISLRFFNVSGAAADGSNGQRGKAASHVIHAAVKVACGKKEQMNIFGSDYPTPDGTCIRDYIHVEDLADLICRAIQSLEEGGISDILNCGYGQGYSVSEIVETIKKVSEVNFQVVKSARRTGDAVSTVADSAKVQSKWNWSPRYNNLELICLSAFKWERSQP